MILFVIFLLIFADSRCVALLFISLELSCIIDQGPKQAFMWMLFETAVMSFNDGKKIFSGECSHSFHITSLLSSRMINAILALLMKTSWFLAQLPFEHNQAHYTWDIVTNFL